MLSEGYGGSYCEIAPAVHIARNVSVALVKRQCKASWAAQDKAVMRRRRLLRG